MRSLTLIGLLATAGGSASAFELSTEATVAAVRTDNVSPGSPVKSSSTLGLLRAGAEIQSVTSRLELGVDAEVTRYQYLQGGYDPETLPQLSGIATWHIMPERLSWFVRDDYGQVGGLSFGEIRPIVRENINYFTTGPTLTVPLGGRNELELGGSYADVHTSGAGVDSNRYQGSAQLRRRISDRRNAGLNFSYTKIDYDAAVSLSGYDRSVASARFASNARRGTLLAEVGASRVTRPGRAADTARLFNFELDRRLGSRSTLALRLSSESSDAADAFRDGIGSSITPGSGDSQLPLNGEPFMLDSASLEWSHASVRLTTQVRLLREKERYDDTGFADRERTGMALSGAYRWSSRDESRAAIRHERNASDDVAFRDRNWSFEVGHTHRIARELYATLNYMHFRREREVVTTNQSENRWMLTISFRPSPFTIGRPLGTERRSGRGMLRQRSVGSDLAVPQTSEQP
ncbi:MAG: hypothetical protein U1F18_07960 [Steroidobacteraceae bacterium]